jgi:hypothetical protein
MGIFYLTSIRENEAAHPSPDRLVALAALIERTAPDARREVLGAVSSPQFVVRTEPANASPGRGSGTSSQQAKLREAYASALAGRAIDIVAPSNHPPNQWFPRLSRLMANAVEFRIALHTGETLVVEATTRLPVTPLGLPIGFGAGLFGTIVALMALLVMQRETRPLARLAAAVDRVDLSADPRCFRKRAANPRAHRRLQPAPGSALPSFAVLSKPMVERSKSPGRRAAARG